MNKIEAIQIGKEWLANSPPFDGVYVGPDFMSGAAGCVCRECCRRIVGRGCDLKRIASVPVWEASGDETCSLCGFDEWEWHEPTSESGDREFWTSLTGEISFVNPATKPKP